MRKKADDSFYSGMLAALSVVVVFDAETIYREIVGTAGEENLIRVARKMGDMKLSGLSRYGYGRRQKGQSDEA